MKSTKDFYPTPGLSATWSIPVNWELKDEHVKLKKKIRKQFKLEMG